MSAPIPPWEPLSEAVLADLASPTAAPVLGQSLLSIGTITITGGTGRFVNASGTGMVRSTTIFEGYNDPEWPTVWEVPGRFSY